MAFTDEKSLFDLMKNAKIGLFNIILEESEIFLEGNKTANEILDINNEPTYLEVFYKRIYENDKNIFKNKFYDLIRNGGEFKLKIKYYCKKNNYKIINIYLKDERQKNNKISGIIQEDPDYNIGKNIDANISHEIRTPISSIYNMLEFLSKTELSKNQLEYVYKSKKLAEELNNIIDNILELSKIEAGKTKIINEKFNLNNILSEILNTYKMDALNKSLNIYVKNNCNENILIGDEIKLKQILSNLIGNSVKFTEKGSINIGIDIKNKINNKVFLEFKISDTGIGISKNQAEEIFNPFIQGDNNKNISGSGLGLAITKRLIDILNGKIYFITEENKGTVFKLNLEFLVQEKNIPLEENLENKEKLLYSKENILEKIKNKNILIADDDEINGIMLKEMLDINNKIIDSCSNGIEALNLLQNKKYDLIFLDINMPKINGLEVTKEIRESQKYKDTPIIFISANNIEDIQEKIKILNVNGFIKKPINPYELYNCIEKCL